MGRWTFDKSLIINIKTTTIYNPKTLRILIFIVAYMKLKLEENDGIIY